jgi:hypothetical protein
MSTDPQQIAKEIAAGFYAAGQLAAPVPSTDGESAIDVEERVRSLIESGWEAFYAHYFGQAFVDSLAQHHREAVEWHWDSRLAFLRNERPDHLAYFPIWSRGHMKSTLAEHIVVVDAMLSAFFKQPGFCLYVGREKGKVRENVGNIETLITGDSVRADFPTLGRVKRNEETNQTRQWTATFLHTEAGYVVKGGTIDSAQAGSRVVSTRPTFIVPDDIDGRKDSPVISESNFRQLTTEILPMRQENTLVFFAQNLISRYSVMYRIQKQQARVLTNRKPTQPIPAVRNLVTDVQTVGGIVKDIYVSGESTWPQVWNAQRIQDEIESEGLPAFLRECQHEVEQDREGQVLQFYDDSVHVISRSEFASVYGTRDLPQKWNKRVFNDWARTKTKHHANVAGILTTSAQNSPLPGAMFLFHPLSFKAGAAPEDVAERLLSVISPTVRTTGGQIFTWKQLIKSTVQKTSLSSLIGDLTELINAQREVLARVIPKYVTPILQAQHYNDFRGSHEQSKTGALAVYQKVFGLPFKPTNPGGDGGVDMINMIMRVDYSKPHAFRQGAMGYTGFYVVAEDDTSAEPVPVNGVLVYPPVPYNESLTPDDLHDADLARYQFKNWRFRDPHLTVQGEREGELLKLNDDFGNGLMMLFYDTVLAATPLTYAEQVTEAIPPQHRLETLQKESPYEHGLLPHQELTYVINKQFAEKRIQPRITEYNEWGEPV